MNTESMIMEFIYASILGKKGDPASLLPPVTTADNGKILKVVNGAWAAVTEPDVSQDGM